MAATAANIPECPAVALAREIAELDARLGSLGREMEAANRPTDAMERLEGLSERVIESLEAARWKLAATDPTSVNGAVAQLLAALRDQEIRDTDETRRAKALETRAMRFLIANDFVEPAQRGPMSTLSPCMAPPTGHYGLSAP